MTARRPLLFSVFVLLGCLLTFGSRALGVRAGGDSTPVLHSLAASMPVAQANQAEPIDPEAALEQLMSGPEGQKLMKTFKWASVIMTIGSAVCFVGGLWLLINAFRVSVWWGLGYLFVPFVALFFLFSHWDEARKPFGIWFLGVLISLGGLLPMFLQAKDRLPTLYEEISQIAEGIEGEQPTQQTRTVRIPAAFPDQPAQTTLESIVPADSDTGEPVRLGDSEVRVKELMPKPRARLKQGGRVYYLFPNVEIWLNNDEVVVIRPPGVWGEPSE